MIGNAVSQPIEENRRGLLRRSTWHRAAPWRFRLTIRPMPGLCAQGSAGVSLAQHSAVKGVRERRRRASGLETQAKNDAIELKQSRLDPMSVEPISHLAHHGGYAVAVTANFNNVHMAVLPPNGGIWGADHYRYVTALGPDRCQLPNAVRRKRKERPKSPPFGTRLRHAVAYTHSSPDCRYAELVELVELGRAQGVSVR